MSTTTIAGKPGNTIGEKDSTLVLRGSSIKIQWGNKFIDLIKNGKINSDSQKLLKTADSTEELTTDGLYLVGDSVWAVIGGTKVQLSGDSTTTYVSYLTEQKDITGEQKERALTNIGFYYNTLEEAQNSGLTSGIIYVQGDNKLYIVKDGVASEYGMTLNNSQNPEETEKLLEKLYIEEYSLMVDGEEYAIFDNNDIQLNKITYFKEGINSYGANANYGYRLYVKDGKSYLEVDNIIERDRKADVGNVNIQKIKYYQDENIIIGVNSEDNLVLSLLYSDKYKVGDILTTSMLLEKEIITTEGTEQIEILEQTLVPIDFKIDSISGDKKEYTVTILSEEQELVQNNIQNLLNKSIYYKQGELPVARISDHNYDLFKPYTDQTLENINLRIGSLQELEVSLLGKKISEYTKEDLGIYSDNAFLKNSYLFDTSQYNTVFKNYNNIYPKYDEGWFIPDTSDDQTIVTSLWVNDKIEPIWTEINVIKESIKSIEDLEDRLDQAELDINQAESDIDELEKSVKNLEDSLDSLGGSILDVSSDVSTLKSNVATITTNISTLQTDLDSAESKITTTETAISTLKTDVSNLKNADISINNEIDDIWEEIDNITDSSNTANLQEQIDELTSKVEELSLLPSILISGNVFRDDVDSLTWKFTGVAHPNFGMSTSANNNYVNSQTLTTSINGGVLQIDWTLSRHINIVACCANMQTSGMVTIPTEGEYMSTDNDQAMYWLGTYANGISTYIRAMTQHDKNNDTAVSSSYLWGPVQESHKYGILSFSIIAIGYVF